MKLRLRTITLADLVVYVVLTIYITTAGAFFNVRFLPVITPVLTVLAFIFALLHGSERLGWKHTLLLLGLTFGISLLFESVGVATGWVYGGYHYTEKLGVRFLDLVPYLIPVAWFMMMYPSYIIASRLIPRRWGLWQWRLGVAAVGGLAMTAWDLAMDPLMVASGHWVWDVQGAYFGIPLQNFWGWWLTTFITFALFVVLSRAKPPTGESQPLAFDRLALVSYLITGASTVIIDLRGDLAGPGLVGVFAMLPWLMMGWVE